MRFLPVLSAVLLGSATFSAAQTYQFNGISGINSATDGSIDGWTVADQFGSNQYSGYVGELALIFANQNDVPGGIGVPRGTFLGDAGDTYAGDLGLVVFCIDSETAFGNSGSPAQTFTYEAYAWGAAENRYLSEGVSSYQLDGLLRAAYLLETYYDEAHDGGDLGASALQAAIWEVLADASPDLSTGSGMYFVRNNTGSTTLNQRSNDIISLTSGWFAAAEAAGWGGPDYDPEGRVAFWLDPDNVTFNQSVISLVPTGMDVILVPEPGSALLLLLGGVVTLLRRRRPS